MNRALIYLRVSTDRQAQKGLSIPAQQEKCLEVAIKRGYQVELESDCYVDEGESARTTRRRDFQLMLERIRNDKGVGAVICYDISRLARDRVDYYSELKKETRKRGINICSATEPIDDTPEGQVVEGIMVTFAEYYSLQMGRKIKLGMLQKVKGGTWTSIAPFGYKNCRSGIGNDKDRRWIEVNDDEAPWVQKTFQMFATGNYSLQKLATVLSKQGFPMRTSKRLHQGFLHRILTNPAYIGKIPFKGEVYDGTHAPLIDEATMKRVKDILFEHGKGADRSQKYRFPLKGIIYCDVCGAKYTGEQHVIKNGDTVRYLRCMKRVRGERTDCNEKYFQEEHISNQFNALFKTIQLPDGFTEKLRDKIKSIFGEEQKLYEKSRKSILTQLETIKRQKKELVLRFIDNAKTNSDENLFASVKTDLEAKEESLNKQLTAVEGNMANAIKIIEMALTLANNCYRAYQKANPSLKGLLAKVFFQKVTVRDGEIVSAILNPPLDFLCRKRIGNQHLFKLGAYCGPRESRTPTSSMPWKCSTAIL